MTGRLSPKTPMVAASTMDQATLDVRPMYRSASRSPPLRREDRLAVGTARGRITATMITTSRHDAALIRNDQPWPTAWIRAPDAAGPTRAPSWKTEELRLTALRMWACPT